MASNHAHTRSPRRPSRVLPTTMWIRGTVTPRTLAVRFSKRPPGALGAPGAIMGRRDCWHRRPQPRRRGARGPRSGAARRSSRASPTTTAGPGRPTGRRCSGTSARTAGSAAGRTPCGCCRRPPTEALERAADDSALLERAAAVQAAVEADLARPPADAPATPDRPAAFFCAEYGVHRSLPIYSGGLGALAGDILKEASDRALPLVAVGLLYRQGYFRQRIDAGGWQHEYWVDTDPERVPAALVTGADGEPVTDHGARPRPRGHRAAVARRRRPRPAAAPRHGAAGERRRGALDHLAPLHRRPRRCGSRSTSCSASAACARCRRWTSSRASCT